MLGHADNYMRADSLVTPAHIVPEWYFLPFYAMLKAFPSKAAGAIAMVSSMAILATLPWVDGLMGVGSLVSDPRFRPFFRLTFLVFVMNMVALGWLGGLAVSDVNQIWMQICTAFYFSYFLVLTPLTSGLEGSILNNTQIISTLYYKHLLTIKLTMILLSAKIIAACLATISLIGAGVVIGNLFGSFLIAISRNPLLFKTFFT